MIMGFFSNISGEQRSIFANELALDYNFVPKLIPFRDMQQKYIASCIKPLFSNRNGKNIVLFGPPGVGKTVATRHILNEMEEESDDIVPVYINCWNKNTSYKVAIEICDILDYKFTQNKKTEELFAIIKNLLNRKSAVFVFDEIDKAEDYDFLYTLLEDIYRKTIILITNYKSWVAELDDRIKSRLVPELLEFRAYNREEINGILKERAGYAFIPQCVEEPVFDFVAKRTIDMGGDVRTGIYMLREAGMIAEESGQGCVMIGHAEKATSKMVDFSIKKTEELFAIIKNLLNRKSAVFVFDEIDKAEDYDFLYTLLEDIYRKTVILITNYKSWVAELDDRIKSRLVPEMLEFRAYNREEINGILKERAGYAFKQQCVEEPVFDFVAKKTIEMGGDVRTGIYMLREAGMIAEESGQGCVMMDHAEKATAKMVDFSIKKTEELDDDTQKIFTMVKMKSGGKIGELFKLYQDEGGNLSYKSFQRKIAKLEENKFISAEKIMGGSEGTTTMISLPQEKKLTEF